MPNSAKRARDKWLAKKKKKKKLASLKK